MKFYISQIDHLLLKIAEGDIKALLLYGPDKGYISKICQTISKKFALFRTSTPYSALTAGRLNMILNSHNFYAKREFIKITDVGSGLNKDLKDILTGNFKNFAAFIADELPPSSTIRQFFEKTSSLAVIGCYHADEKNITELLLQKSSQAKKTFTAPALKHLKQHLKGDHNFIINELDKLFCFVDDKTPITLDDVMKVTSESLIASGDELFIYLANAEADKFLNELDKLIGGDINPVLIIRALIRYYINSYIIFTKVKTGNNLNDAVKTLSPPIFFKYVADFTRIVSKISDKQTLKALSVLQQAEVSYKLNPKTFDFYQQIYLPICGNRAA